MAQKEKGVTLQLVKVSSKSSLFELTGKFGHDKPLKRIFQIILSQGCKTIVVENEYEDSDYKNEYENFYKKLFKTYAQNTQRLHFFSSNITKTSLGKLGSFENTYLGFCVLRPFQYQKVVNAIIKPTEDCNPSKRSFVLCQEDFNIEIKINSRNTQKLKIRGFPFKQQDGQLGCCAHASLATIDHFLAHKNRKKPCDLSDIIEKAAQVPDTRRAVPSTGLNAVQISQALKGMGYVPLIYQYGEGIRSPFPAERVIYHYMESGIPIMLGIPTSSSGHALTIIGHSFEPDMWWALAQSEYYRRRPSGGPYHCSTTWIQNFIIHDDNFGPYLTIPKEFIWEKAAKEGLLIVVPLPEDVNIQGEDAEIYAYRMISDQIITEKMMEMSLENKITQKWCEVFFDHLQNEDLVLRTCLLDSKKFKKEYTSENLKEFYKTLAMPNKIWLTEVSIPELFCQSRLRLGEVITDSTSNMKFGHSFLAIHLPGIVVTRDVNTEKIKYFPLKEDLPFGHIIR
ncbi:MAG: hypothetical protein FVQ80_03615 [Planctomycetes bacterium]|nr:hypothetical protein [Planctomycetota bacterium]